MSKVTFRVSGHQEGAKYFGTEAEARMALKGLYEDNLYRWFRQNGLGLWKHTEVEGARRPVIELLECFTVGQLAKM